MQDYMRLLFRGGMTFVECQENLHEYFPDNVFGNEILLGSALLDQLGHVSVLAVLHHNVELVFLLQDDPTERKVE